MNNRIKRLFKEKDGDVLSIYFSAGYPGLEDTIPMLENLQAAGVDLVEIGIPYSDPICDGPVIQHSSNVALENGMSVPYLLKQLSNVRDSIEIPLVIMSSLNPLLQYGMEKFCREISEIGIDGLIIPDLPFAEFKEKYSSLFAELNLSNVFLITPQTSDERVREFDSSSDGFLYVVSSSSTTGKDASASEGMGEYLERIKSLKLSQPLMVGFGISNAETYSKVLKSAWGAIIGSAFIKAVKSSSSLEKDIRTFVSSIR